jgi:hypothetical protein
MIHHSVLVLTTILLFVAAGCQSTNPASPQVINHPAPQFPSLNMAVFEAAGCSPNEFGSWDCPEDSPISVLGCDSLSEPGELLGALNPNYPLARCLYFPIQDQQENPDALNAPRLFNEGCLLPVYVRYVISKEEQFTAIQIFEDLQEVYAPIESPNEALSYALAATGLEAKYGIQRQPGFRYFQESLEDTFVTERGGGYELLLYHYQVCGCGPHTTSAVRLRVSRDGTIEEVSNNPVYEDPAEDGLCVD